MYKYLLTTGVGRHGSASVSLNRLKLRGEVCQFQCCGPAFTGKGGNREINTSFCSGNKGENQWQQRANVGHSNFGHDMNGVQFFVEEPAFCEPSIAVDLATAWNGPWCTRLAGPCVLRDKLRGDEFGESTNIFRSAGSIGRRRSCRAVSKLPQSSVVLAGPSKFFGA